MGPGMIRIFRYVLLFLAAVVLLTVALANRGVVEVRLLPDGLAALTGLSFSIQIPLFLVLFGGIALGVLVGFVWEWAREHKHRSTATRSSKQVARLERELAVMRDSSTTPKDDVLALLDKPATK
jgi:uncharacterized integral membrane protein